MREPRQKVLESRKTVSRKAQSRVTSQSSAGSNSYINAKDRSRLEAYSEEKISCDSLDGRHIITPDLPLDTSEIWAQNLENRVDEIINRKRSSVKGREDALATYTNLLSSHYALDEIQRKTSELFPAFIKSVKAENSEKETCYASHALALTFITVPSEDFYDAVHQGLKQAIKNSGYKSVKASAIHTLSVAAIYGGASDSEIDEIMDELLGIIESDGHSVDAADEAEVVTAASQAVGYLATYQNDLEEKSEIALDAFLEQLESSDVSVQVAAGENIALFYEKIYDYQQSKNGRVSEKEDEEDVGSDSIEPRNLYHRVDHALHMLKKLASESSRSIAKKDRKILHSIFSDVLNTVEHPNRGPRYQNAINDQTGKRYGSRMSVRIQKTASLRIDKWWKLHRLQALKRILGGGFVIHYQNNEAVFESLPSSKVGG
ncbi:hypothetical protein K3495_g1763 [Podosphaera aphanis]|nr:hypothetical protein K3495_g1763 [Podosphaera aphanis]